MLFSRPNTVLGRIHQFECSQFKIISLPHLITAKYRIIGILSEDDFFLRAKISAF